MKITLKSKLALTALLTLAGAFTSFAGSPLAPVTMKITGGSTARYLNTSHSLNTTGYTDFSVNVTVRQDGTASGEFVCAVPNGVVIAGQAANATVNSDGSVTITGVGYGYFVGGGGFDGDAFYATFRPGGPQVGGFDFADANFPAGFYDSESLLLGAIKITR